MDRSGLLNNDKYSCIYFVILKKNCILNNSDNIFNPKSPETNYKRVYLAVDG